MPRITGFASTGALHHAENKIPKDSDLVKKNQDYDAKVSGIESKYFTTSDYNKFTRDILDAQTKKDGVNKCDISKFINNYDLNNKIETLPTKADLKASQDKIGKFLTYDSNLFTGQSYFVNDRLQSFIIFQPIYKT